MVYVFTRSWYPSHKASEVAKIYAEVLQKYPPDASLGEIIIPVAGKATKDGLEFVGVSKPNEGKLQQLLTRTVEIMANFNDVEGYEYAIEVWAGPEDVPTT